MPQKALCFLLVPSSPRREGLAGPSIELGSSEGVPESTMVEGKRCLAVVLRSPGSLWR